MLVLILLAIGVLFLPQMSYFYVQDQQILSVVVDRRQGECPFGVNRLTKFEVDCLMELLANKNSLIINVAERKTKSFQTVINRKLVRFIFSEIKEKKEKKLKVRGESLFCKSLIK